MTRQRPYATDRTGLKKIMSTNMTNEKLIALIGATGLQGVQWYERCKPAANSRYAH